MNTWLAADPWNRRGVPLSPRQREVHELIRAGMTDKMIARQLGISYGTTKVHVATILIRLGARNRTAAAAIQP